MEYIALYIRPYKRCQYKKISTVSGVHFLFGNVFKLVPFCPSAPFLLDAALLCHPRVLSFLSSSDSFLSCHVRPCFFFCHVRPLSSPVILGLDPRISGLPDQVRQWQERMKARQWQKRKKPREWQVNNCHIRAWPEYPPQTIISPWKPCMSTL